MLCVKRQEIIDNRLQTVYLKHDISIDYMILYIPSLSLRQTESLRRKMSTEHYSHVLLYEGNLSVGILVLPN